MGVVMAMKIGLKHLLSALQLVMEIVSVKYNNNEVAVL